MNIFSHSICVLATSLAIINTTVSLAGGPNADGVASGALSYASRNPEGVIGITAETPFDNPVDNIFHINIPESVCPGDRVWLVYELDGVADHTNVSRSINDQVSVGGYLVQKRTGWQKQRERINPSWLKAGDNIVRFTTPLNASHGYRVKGLKFEVESADDEQEQEVVFNQPSLQYFFDKAYLKGFLTGAGYDQARIRVGGREVKLFNGEFESIIDFRSAQGTCNVEVEAVYPDGTTVCHTVTYSEPQTADYTFEREHFIHRNEKLFTGANATSLSLNGAVIVSEPGALNMNAVLSITTLRAVDIPALDAGMVNVTKGHAGFRFLPHGSVFNKELHVTIPYDSASIPDGYTAQDIRTYYFDEQSHHWIPLKLDTVITGSGAVISKTLHFTDMINGIIKVPESPEVEAYNSTSMKGIKAANPTAAVNLINPPQANNTGSAGLSYPINIPAGRNGMQPQLAVSYNSGGGNGWMGLGWNLTLPSISIDTRWGVPRYDSLKETETYSFNGEQLTPLAHRGELQNRYPDKKQFFPRVEGGFNKIIRRGDKPWNYYWEVTDKSGTKYFYGATASGFDKDAVLRTNEVNDNGNVAHWCLREVRDLNGNTVRYHYAKTGDVGVSGGSVKGYQIYIDKITYTGHHGTDGPYVVQFIRENTRPDKVIAANLGFKQVTGDRLKRIEVKYDDKGAMKKIRAYEMEYKTGPFVKSLLVAIREFDSQDKPFTSHTFDYYDEVDAQNGYKPFNTEDKINTFDDNIVGGFLNKGLFNDKASVLSGSQSENIGAGLSVTAGPIGNLATKSNTAGVNYSYSHSTSDGRSMLIDLNGDGLPDKLMMFKDGRDKTLKYRPQLKQQDGTLKFGDLRPVNGVSEFLKETSNSHDFGIESNFGIFAGVNYSISKSKTSTYFADVNGDGLSDMVSDGRVYFNRLDLNGDPDFQLASAGTPNPIFPKGTLDGSLITVNPDEVQLLKDQNPLNDVVRVWRAPFDGTVNVEAPVELIQDNSEARQEYTTADGVRVAVQVRGEEKWSTKIGAVDYQPKTPSGVSSIDVQKGDRIYFRVNSVEDGAYDKVRWNPIIQYTQHHDTITDANGLHVYRYQAKDEYLAGANQDIGMPFKGTVKLESRFVKPVTSDDVVVEVVQIRGNTETILYSKKHDDQAESDEPITLETSVEEGDKMAFRVKSSSNVKWNAIQWKPLVYYTASDDPTITDIYDENNNPLIKVHGVPHFWVYPEIFNKTVIWKATEDDTVTVTPFVSFTKFVNVNPTEVYFTIKKLDSLIAKDTIVVTDTLTSALSALSVPVKKGEKLFIEYHTRNYMVAANFKDVKAIIESGNSAQTIDAGLSSALINDFNPFGTLYRNWGSFTYNGNDGRDVLAMDETKLKAESLSKPGEIDLSNSTSEEDMNGKFESSNGHRADKEIFSMMYVEGGKQRWMGNDDLIFINLDTLSSSRMGLDQIADLFPELSQGGGTAYAIDKITKSNQTSLAVSGGPAGASGSKGNSRVITDFMDMNGDRYPDILGEYKIQYTLPQGGLEESSRSHGWEFGHRTSLLSGGVSAGGGFPKSGKEASNSAKSSFFSSIGQATSLNVSALWSSDEAEYTWLDINGDGLPDRVNEDGMVSLNLGYSFAPAEDWGSFAIREGSAENFSGGLGVNIKNLSIAAGVGYSRSDNRVKESLQDMNGDGLPDKVVVGSSITVYFNTGNGFDGTPVTWGNISEASKGAATSWSANAAFTIGIPLVPPTAVAKLCINPKVFYSKSFNRQQIQVSDVDGDGYPDYLASDHDGELKVQSSTIRRTNLLKEVKRPLGASFTLSYKLYGQTYEMSNSVWALDSIRLFDGFANDGADYMLTSFEYEGGLYDRHEREFYGFSKVITNSHDTEKPGNPVYTTVTQTFNNGSYYEKGLLLRELMTDGSGNKYVEKENMYMLKDIHDGSDLPASAKTDDAGNAFPALMETSQKFYEGRTDAGKSTTTIFEYDSKGNVISYQDLGDDGVDDDVLSGITYYNIEGPYIIGTPKLIEVSSGGVIYRKRESVIDENNGNVTQVKQYISEDKAAITDMEYDQYGNMVMVIKPENATGQRLTIESEFDDEVHSYPTKVTNSYGYSSSATYDVRFGQVLNSVDINGNEIQYQLDDVGRVKNVTGPYEKGGANHTIEFEYSADAEVPWALTRHYDPAHPKNPLLTATFVDGLGRVLQTKKDIAIFDGEAKSDIEMMSVSGWTTFDALGRVTSVLYPITEVAGTPGKFNSDKDGEKPTQTFYDVLNRKVRVIMPDQSVATISYGFENDRMGNQQFVVSSVDPNGNVTKQFSDVNSRVVAVKNFLGDQAVWTSFKYNPMGEQIEATNDQGYTTFSVYDNLGRKTSRTHPDAGTTSFKYDAAGNIIEVVTANLSTKGLAITYTYDFERVLEINYPENSENNVKYTYGEPGASDNRAGRIVLQEDATGAQEFFYGPLGEVVKNVRTIVIPQHDEQTYSTEWTYDTWGRLTDMTYADGEKVTFEYNVGGLLRGMTGKKKNSIYSYVNQLGYDKFEQRVFLSYGNGTKTSYTYESDRRRLKNLVAQTSAKRVFMDNVYAYDKMNNVLSVTNNAPVPTSNLMGGSSEYHYAYDDLYQLTTAEGYFKGANDEHTYSLSVNYNSVGGILSKNQVHKRKDQEQKKTTYSMDYAYGETQPHAPIHIGDQTYEYDANGNQTGWSSDISGQRRKILWDEENRIRGVYDNGALYHYIYDASGERTLKGQSTGQRIFVNGEWKAGSGQMGNYTVYVNPYLVLKSGGYTKHYYIENQRIVSKLGGGWDNNGQGPLKAGEGKVDYAGKRQRIFDGIVKNLKFLGSDGQILTAGKSGKVPPGQVNNGAGNNITEAFRYFYHPDHLGSTNYITDASGEVYQHLEYMPFGETLVEEHSNSNRTPFLFNGKELDEETGLYYYGARYYDPKTSVWLSVDPLAEKYPTWSPYVYAFNNPINYVDPTGMGPDDPETHTIQKGETLTSISKKYGVSVDDLVTLNGIKDRDKIIAGETLKVNPEVDFSSNPHGGYRNQNNAQGDKVEIDNIVEVGTDFVIGTGKENNIVSGGALKTIQNWDKVQDLIKMGIDAINDDCKVTPGEVYTNTYRPGNLPSYLKRVWEGKEKLVSPVHVIGSFGFSMRVNADGKSMTIAVYDSKTFTSFTDNNADRSSNKPRDNSNSKLQPLTTQYFRFIWNQPIK